MLAPEWPGWTAPFHNGLGTIPERCECNGWARTWQTVRHNVNDLPLLFLLVFPQFIKQRNTPCATSSPSKQLLSQRQCKRETWPTTMPGIRSILFAQRNNDGSRLKIKREIGRSRAHTPSSQANNGNVSLGERNPQLENSDQSLDLGGVPLNAAVRFVAKPKLIQSGSTPTSLWILKTAAPRVTQRETQGDTGLRFGGWRSVCRGRMNYDAQWLVE